MDVLWTCHYPVNTNLGKQTNIMGRELTEHPRTVLICGSASLTMYATVGQKCFYAIWLK